MMCLPVIQEPSEIRITVSRYEVDFEDVPIPGHGVLHFRLGLETKDLNQIHYIFYKKTGWQPQWKRFYPNYTGTAEMVDGAAGNDLTLDIIDLPEFRTWLEEKATLQFEITCLDMFRETVDFF